MRSTGQHIIHESVLRANWSRRCQWVASQVLYVAMKTECCTKTRVVMVIGCGAPDGIQRHVVQKGDGGVLDTFYTISSISSWSISEDRS